MEGARGLEHRSRLPSSLQPNSMLQASLQNGEKKQYQKVVVRCR